MRKLLFCFLFVTSCHTSPAYATNPINKVVERAHCTLIQKQAGGNLYKCTIVVNVNGNAEIIIATTQKTYSQGEVVSVIRDNKNQYFIVN